MVGNRLTEAPDEQVEQIVDAFCAIGTGIANDDVTANDIVNKIVEIMSRESADVDN